MRVKSNLKKLIDAQNIGLSKLSELTGVFYPSLNKFKEDTVKCYDSVVVAKICLALNCKIEDLLEIEEGKK